MALAGCRQAEQAPREQRSEQAAPALAVYVGTGRDRLCLAADGKRAGLIVYGTGDMNCSVQGVVGPGDALVPNGDNKCRIPLRRSDGSIELGPVTADCSYYCGPSASLQGKGFRLSPGATPPTDLAGAPLC